jgi:hypothetical protein
VHGSLNYQHASASVEQQRLLQQPQHDNVQTNKGTSSSLVPYRALLALLRPLAL